MNKPIAIVLGGLVAGALDIVYAFIVYGPLSYGVTPMQVLQSVAAGWIGREVARDGGMGTALLGLGTHFMIATIMAAVFVFAASAFSALSKRPVLWGFVYGLVLYVLMNYVVVPLSAAGAGGHFPSDLAEVLERLAKSFSALKTDDAYPWMIWGTLFTHTVLVAIPISLINARFAPQQA